jgi:opacity protein-like surface antigen
LPFFLEAEMKRLILVFGMAMMSVNALAQQAFDGFNIQLGIGGAQSQVKANSTNDTSLTPEPNINNPTTATSFNGIASIGYSQSFDNLFKGFNLAGNLFYLIGNQSSGSVSNTFNTVNPIDLGSVTETLGGKYKLQNTWGISIEPGYYFSKDILGYLKFAYVSSTLNSSFTCNTSDNYCLSPGGSFGANAAFSTNKTTNGIGYGIGGKYQITKNIYGALDFMYVDYSKVNQTLEWTSEFSTNAGFKPQQYMGFLSVGYKF